MKRKETDHLEFLIREYRSKGKARKALINITELKNQDKIDQLSHYLRFHQQLPIRNEIEVEFRDNIDYLIRFYSILPIAILSGYISTPSLDIVREEILYILGDDSIRKFYELYYPLVLPQVLYNIVLKDLFFDNAISKSERESFEQFLLLERFLQEDNDILTFLWFLDEGGTSDNKGNIYHIETLLALLKNKGALRLRIRKKINLDPLDAAFRGFIKYVNFLSMYKKLLDNTNNALLTSAIWHYQYYWFNLLKLNFSSIIDKAFQNLTELLTTVSSLEFYEQNSSFSRMNDNNKDDYTVWQREALITLEEARFNLLSILDAKYQLPLEEFLFSIKK